MEVFIETRVEEAKVVESETTPEGKRKLTFEATVARGNFINANRRYYPTDVLWPAFQRVNEAVARFPGEVDHPTPGSVGSFSNNGIRWHSFWQEGDEIKGRGEIIWTQRGADLAANIEAGVAVGFSTRTYAKAEKRSLSSDIGAEEVTYITEMEPPFVDAVVTPSVRDARITNFTKESDEMEEKLAQLQSELEAANASIAAKDARIGELESVNSQQTEAASVATNRVAELEGQLAEANAKIATFESDAAEVALTAKLNSLTEGHRFAAAIISEARELGVDLNSAERVVGRLKGLVEAAALTESGSPRGETETEEDVEVEGDTGNGFTEAQMEDLRLSGLA